MKRAVAIFDFDGTLVQGDSLPVFVSCCVGWPRTVLAASVAFLVSLGAADRRTAFKAMWLKLALRGFAAERLPAVLERLESRLAWVDQSVARLQWHKQRGDIIVIASGGLDAYLSYILRAYVPNHYLCTALEQVEGRLTGTMLGGNCVREEKARRVQELLRSLEPHGEVWAYGNLPHDLPMLRLATHQVIV